jgi:hypothetical protein
MISTSIELNSKLTQGVSHFDMYKKPGKANKSRWHSAEKDSAVVRIAMFCCPSALTRAPYRSQRRNKEGLFEV